MARVLARLEVLTPIFAPLYKKGFSWRLYASYDYSIREYVDKDKDDIETKKDKYKVDFLFPRIEKDKIDWFSYFLHPLTTIIKKKFGISVKIVEIKPIKIKMGIRALYYGKTQSVVFYETVLPESAFEIDLEVNDSDIGLLNGEHIIYIGRMRSRGAGKCKLVFYNEAEN